MTGRVSDTFAAFADDAAIFPPGLTPLGQAVPDHVLHTRSDYSALVGPLVIGAATLIELPPHIGHMPPRSLDLSVTVPAPDGIQAVVTTCALLPSVRLVALEVVVPPEMSPEQVVPMLDASLAGMDVAGGALQVYVEVPRDERRAGLMAALADSPYRAKFRTGGVKAELYPDEAELAAAIHAAVSAGVPFKATAGLHHAVRNTDPKTGFEQHGFLNILSAVDAAQQGGDTDALVAILADRDGASLAQSIGSWSPERAAAARSAFVSFGTCSVTDPLTELVDLGLIAPGSHSDTDAATATAPAESTSTEGPHA